MKNSQEYIYITLPKNISFSVFEALKNHVKYFESANYKVVYLSRSKSLEDDRMIYFDSVYSTINYLRKKKKGIIYGITVIEIIIAFLSNLFTSKKQIVFWVQGLIDEEDFLSKKKRYRYYIYNFLLKISLKIADKLVLVTSEMHRVLINKYNLCKTKDVLILNCISRVKYDQSEKIKNSLCYIGGLSEWQNVDKILIFYNKLLKVKDDFTLYIATFDHSEAKQLINSFVGEQFKDKIKLIHVKEQEEVTSFLSKMEYGFLIRDNILLNNVASPIKLAEYLSCGINPIISDSLVEFGKLIAKNECGVVIKNNNFDRAIDDLINFTPNINKAISLYNSFFERKTIVKEISDFLNK